MQIIRLIATKEPNRAQHWEFLNSKVTDDTMYFKFLRTFETNLQDLKSDKIFTFRAEDYLDSRVFNTDNGTVVEAIKVIHSNNEVPSGSYLADIGRYFFRGYRVLTNIVINPEGVFEEFVILLDNTFKKHGGVNKR